MLQLFVNGPPGAGKTSLCKLLCEEFGLELVATGDLLRENILQRTPLGVVAKECISRKSLVPDHVVVDMVAEKICECVNRKGWVLDGFPRTTEQSAALRRKQIFPNVAIVLELSEGECAKRITGRRFDPVTSKIYHMPNVMPRDSAVLARLTRRSDDAVDKLPPRFEAYRQHGEATNSLYRTVLHRVDVTRKPLQEVFDAVVDLLHSARPFQNHEASGTTPTRGNQVQSSIASGMARLRQMEASVTKRAPHLHQVPQKIDEEDEEQVAREILGEINYDEAEEAKHPRSVSSASVTSAPIPASIDDEIPRIGVSFKTMHADMGRPVAIHTDQSPSLSPHSSPSPSPSSSKAKTAPETETFTFQSNNAEPAVSPMQNPVSSPTGQDVTGALRRPSSATRSTVDMTKFKDLLLDGFDVLKHGRRGSPHARTIFADMEFKRIFWMKPGKEAKAKKAKLDQSLLLADVVQVVRGMKTEVLKRSGDVSKYERYLSLVADDRTLDLELPSEAMSEFSLRGFEQLLHGSS